MERMYPKTSHEERTNSWHANVQQSKRYRQTSRWGNIQHLAMPLWDLQRRLNAERREKDARNLKDRARRAKRKGQVS